jgi:uncharacterized protein
VHCSKKQENCARLARLLRDCLGLRMSRQSSGHARGHPQSPCDSTCRIDPASGLCHGCKRTLAEIADWPMLAATEKRAVLERLKRR